MAQFFQRAKELFFKALLPILVSLVLVVAIVFAQWVEPGLPPPGDNVDAPLNAGGIMQTKEGGLIVANNSLVDPGFIVRYGKVGIGTTSPGEKLTVVGNIIIQSGNELRFNNPSNSRNSRIKNTALPQDSNIEFWTGDNAVPEVKMILTEGGNVGIGTTSPGAKLEIAGQIKIVDGSEGLNKVLTSDASGLATWKTPSGGAGYWEASGSNIYNTNTGNVGIGTATPTAKLYITDDTSGATLLVQNTRVGGDPARIVVGNYNNQSNFMIGTRWGAGGFIVYDNNAGAARLIIDNSGNVGIGTTSPNAKLHLADIASSEIIIDADTDNVTETDHAKLTLRQDGGLVVGFLGFHDGTNRLLLKNEYADALEFGANNTIYMTMLNNGNVGIGDTTPDATLDVAGSVQLDSFTGGGTGCTALETDGSGNLVCGVDDTGGAGYWEASGSNIYNTNTGNVGIGITNPIYALDINNTSATMNTEYGLRVVTQRGASNSYGIFGQGTGVGTNVGVSGVASGGTTNYAFYGAAFGSNAWGLYIYGGDAYFDGKVGIGTTPGYKLDVSGNARIDSGTAQPPLMLRTTQNDVLWFYRDGVNTNPHTFLDNSGVGFRFWDSSSGELMRINNVGRVDITSDAYVAGQQVCRADGTGCPDRTKVTCNFAGASTCTATCPAGYTVTGGGFLVANNAALSIMDIGGYPNAGNTAWICVLAGVSAGTSTACYAMCMIE